MGSLPVPSLSILFSMNPDHDKTIWPPESSKKKKHTVSLHFDEDTIQLWRDKYKSKNRMINNFWVWIRRGNSPTLKNRVKAWDEKMNALEETQGPLSDEQLHAEAVKKVDLV